MFYALVTSHHGPARVSTPARFLAAEAQWRARRNFTVVLGPARARKYLQRLYAYFIVRMGAERVPRGRRKAPLRTRKVFDPAKNGKISHGRRIYIAMWTHTGPYAGAWPPYVPRTSCLRVVWGPKAYNTCIKTLRAPYAKFVRRPTGPLRAYWPRPGPCRDERFLFKITREQPGNSPYSTGRGSVVWQGH